MRTLKRAALLVSLVIFMFILTGCKLTPEKAVEKMNAALEETPPSGFHVTLETGFSVDMDGVTTDTAMSVDADVLFSREPHRQLQEIEEMVKLAK